MQYSDTTPITPTLRAVAFSPDGTRVAVANSDNDGFVMIYDLALRRRLLQLPMFEAPPSSVAFSPDSQRLVAAGPDYLMEWDLATEEVLRRSLVQGLRDLTRMTYTEDSRWLVISHPRSVTVLDAQTLPVAVADMRLPTEAPTDPSDDAFAVAAGQDHQMLVGTGSVLASIKMDPEQWKSAACQVAARQLTKDEWNRFLPEIPYSPVCH